MPYPAVQTTMFRNELKYFLSYAQYERLRSVLRPFVRPDAYAGPEGLYTIRSLYFDDYANSALVQKAAGVAERRKYRLRFYNNDARFIKMEIKRKSLSFVGKNATTLSQAECAALLAGDDAFLVAERDPDLVRAAWYREIHTRLLRPVVIVDYEREAYEFPADRVRITFDMNVRSGLYATELFDPGLLTLPVLEPGLLILEVKFDHALPPHLQSLLSQMPLQQSAISKYVLCRAFAEKSH